MTIMTVSSVFVAAISLCMALFLLKRLSGAGSQILELRAELRDAEDKYENLEYLTGKLHRQITSLQKGMETANAVVLSETLAEDSAQQLTKELATTVERSFQRMTQEFIGNLSDDASGLANDLQFGLSDRIWDAFQSFKVKVKDSPFLFPDGVKLAYTKGRRTLVVIEQPPQVRSVSFDADLVRAVGGVRSAKAQVRNGYRFSLAFPYVYFFMVFDDNKFQYNELYFRNKPLTSVREHVYLAPIPNVWRDNKKGYHGMCMGNDGFTSKVNEDYAIARQCETVVSQFWQRTFNHHLGSGGHEKIDPRLKSYGTWQKHSEEDPFFVLSVKWGGGQTVKGLVEKILDKRERKHELDEVEQEIRRLLTEGVEKLGKRVNQEVEVVKQQSLTTEDIGFDASKTLENLVVNHTRKVFEECSKT